ncbi:hypothetical protein [Acinetobacter junii]|uniref:hypothetical protein n=1 Tax=Acinetobacter junii TaxID=40215 RepID=UPI000F681E08|nr:hypothetical protein [Acinetobacter junii]RSE35106.1 hypothetical protein EGT62_03960 [Acinetobacter junii]RSE35114.1 hypothetical protein EGT62_04005 [Acinetobacter junii]
MEQNQNQTAKKAVQLAKQAAMATGVVLVTTASAFAEGETTVIDFTTGLAGVAIIGGLLSAGGLKAVPTYVGWGIKKALSMLR